MNIFRFSCLIVVTFFCKINFAQQIHSTIDSIQLNAEYSGNREPTIIQATYNSMGKINGNFSVQMEINGKRITRFRSKVKENRLTGTSIWFDRKGDTLFTVENLFNPQSNGPMNQNLYADFFLPVYLVGNKNGSYKSYRKNEGKLKLAYTCEYKNDKKHGLETSYYLSGNLLTTKMYVQGRADGLFVYYYETGKIFSIGEYIKDIKRGKWIDYHENGKVYRIHSDWNGAMDTLKRFDKNGVLMESAYFSYEKPVGQYKLFHENGKRKVDCFYSDGKREGLSRSWFENGSRFDSIYYKNDYPHGAVYMWWPDGKLRKKALYNNGLEDGKYELYEEGGKLFEKGAYKNGYRIGKWQIRNESGKYDVVDYTSTPEEEVVEVIEEVAEERIEEPIFENVTAIPENYEWLYQLNKLLTKKEKSIISKYKSIRLKAAINKAGQCEFEILSELKKKDASFLMKKFSECSYQWRPFNLNGKSIPSVVYFGLFVV